MHATFIIFLCILIIYTIIFADGATCAKVARCKSVSNPAPSNELLVNCTNVELLYSNADDFIVTKRLGAGFYGEAYRGHNVTSNTIYAMKVYHYGLRNLQEMTREIVMLQSVCGHPNIVRLEHLIQQSLTRNPILIMEFAPATNYTHLVLTQSPEDARLYIHQILSALAFAHERGVMHKDLHSANFMFNHAKRTVKIVDWGNAEFYVPGKRQSGTANRAPEMLLFYPYPEPSTDIWSVGTMFAQMLFGKPLFLFDYDEMDWMKIMLLLTGMLGTKDLQAYNAKYAIGHKLSHFKEPTERQPWTKHFGADRLPFATPDALNLLDRMLVYDHKERISAKDALQHPYFKALHRKPSSKHHHKASAAHAAGNHTAHGPRNGEREGGDKELAKPPDEAAKPPNLRHR